MVEKLLGVQQSYIINMKNQPDKLNHSLDVLKKYGLSEPIRFEAIDGKELLDTEIETLLTPRAYFKLGSLPRTDHDQLGTLGAIGCYLSHVEIWKKIVSQNIQRAFIFEDDITINITKNELEILFTKINKIIGNNIHALFFGSYLRDKNNFKASKGSFASNNIASSEVMTRIPNTKARFVNLHAYVISLEGAKYLLNKAFPIEVQLDSYISYMISNDNMNNYYFVPKGVISQMNWNSTVQSHCSHCNDEIYISQLTIVRFLFFIVICSLLYILINLRN